MASIRQLKTFLAVVRCGNFAAAGKAVGLTAAAVGLQMRALEEDLRQPLFDRGGRTIVLNPSGRALVAPIQTLVDDYEALAAPRDGADLAGTVVMGALVSALMGKFADGLWALKRQHPKLQVTLRAGLSADFAVKVEHGEIDAAIVTQPPTRLPAGLVWTPLYAEPMVLVVPRRAHFALPDGARAILAECPFIRFERQTWTGMLVNAALAQSGATVRDEMELNSIEAILELVRQGFGVSILPKLANVQWSRDRALHAFALPGRPVQRVVGLLERRQHRRQAVTDAMKQYFAAGTARKPRR